MSEAGCRPEAIIFTDVVGFNVLTQADESHYMEVLAKHHSIVRPIFQRFGGREIKTIGDSFLVEFDSALDLLRLRAPRILDWWLGFRFPRATGP